MTFDIQMNQEQIKILIKAMHCIATDINATESISEEESLLLNMLEDVQPNVINDFVSEP